MTTRHDILDAMQTLILRTGSPPSIQQIADAVGLTKQGVLHHFPSRAALDGALARRALARVDQEMERAAREGSPTETYLRLSAPSDADRAAAYVSLSSLATRESAPILEEARDAAQRWQTSMEQELGDPVLAEIARLAGDGLFSQALMSGSPPSAQQVDRLVARLHRARR